MQAEHWSMRINSRHRLYFADCFIKFKVKFSEMTLQTTDARTIKILSQLLQVSHNLCSFSSLQVHKEEVNGVQSVNVLPYKSTYKYYVNLFNEGFTFFLFTLVFTNFFS